MDPSLFSCLSSSSPSSVMFSSSSLHHPCTTNYYSPFPHPSASASASASSSFVNSSASVSTASHNTTTTLSDRCRIPNVSGTWKPNRWLSFSALMENPVPEKHEVYTVGEFMTKLDNLLLVKPSSTVDEALELLVHNRVTGLPVVDDAGKLVGLVSDFDLLALDSISGKRSSDSSLFPEAGSTWKAFRELQKLISKTHGRTVGEVMTPSPLVVREMTNLEDAARLLLETKYRRLPVVNDTGKLLGLLTRGNVIRAALKIKRETEGK